MTSPGQFRPAPFSRPSDQRHHTTPTVTQAAPLNSTTKAVGEGGRRLSEQPSPRRVLMPEYARLGVSSAMHRLSERKAACSQIPNLYLRPVFISTTGEAQTTVSISVQAWGLRIVLEMYRPELADFLSNFQCRIQFTIYVVPELFDDSFHTYRFVPYGQSFLDILVFGLLGLFGLQRLAGIPNPHRYFATVPDPVDLYCHDPDALATTRSSPKYPFCGSLGNDDKTIMTG
ncbi:hypothetical protein B0H14DRAFT_2600108 [Mycena olivaceomarginata]|nr:hypothetical protein B0H14DRAFT_2600108 [Mycena olivaceomarginata]